jgi:hypothetical protein
VTNIYQSTAMVVMFKAFLDTDHVSEATGKTIAITISKNGGAFGNPNAGATNATEVSSGFYKFTLDTTDTNTGGPLAYRGTNADIDDVGGVFYILSAPLATQASVDTIDDLIDSEVGAIKTKTDQLTFSVAGQVDANTLSWLNDTVATPAAAGVPSVELINLNATAQSGIRTAVGLATANLDTQLDALPTAGENADEVWDTLIVGNTDAGSFGEAVNATLAATAIIQSKTDQITFTTANRVDSQVFGMQNGTVTAAAVATGAIDADALAADAVDEIWDEVMEGTTTARQSIRLANSANAGKLSGAATTTVTVRDVADTKNRIVATVDADGNRSALTLDVS